MQNRLVALKGQLKTAIDWVEVAEREADIFPSYQAVITHAASRLNSVRESVSSMLETLATQGEAQIVGYQERRMKRRTAMTASVNASEKSILWMCDDMVIDGKVVNAAREVVRAIATLRSEIHKLEERDNMAIEDNDDWMPDDEYRAGKGWRDNNYRYRYVQDWNEYEPFWIDNGKYGKWAIRAKDGLFYDWNEQHFVAYEPEKWGSIVGTNWERVCDMIYKLEGRGNEGLHIYT